MFFSFSLFVLEIVPFHFSSSPSILLSNVLDFWPPVSPPFSPPPPGFRIFLSSVIENSTCPSLLDFSPFYSSVSRFSPLLRSYLFSSQSLTFFPPSLYFPYNYDGRYLAVGFFEDLSSDSSSPLFSPIHYLALPLSLRKPPLRFWRSVSLSLEDPPNLRGTSHSPRSL